MPTVAELQARVSVAGVQQAQSELSKFDKGLREATGGLVSMGSIGSMALLGIGAAAAKMGTDSISAAMNFEQQMSAVQAVSGITKGEVSALADSAMRLGPAWGQSASEVGRGMEELVKAGISTRDIMGGAAEATMTLAAAGGVDLASAAEVAANSMTIFNLKGSDMAHVADLVAGAANASTMSVNDYRLSLSMVGSVAAMANQSIDSTTAAITAMAQAGVKGSDSGTSLKTMTLALAGSSDTAKAAMRDLGIITADGANQFFDATGKAKSYRDIAEILKQTTATLSQEQRMQALQTVFGSDAIRAATVFAKEGAAGFDKYAEAINKVSAAEVARTRLDNLSGSIRRTGVEMENFATMQGSKTTGVLKGIVDAAGDLIHSLTFVNDTSVITTARFKELQGQGYTVAAATKAVKEESVGAAGGLGVINTMLPDTAIGARDAAAAMRELQASMVITNAQAIASASKVTAQENAWEMDKLNRMVNKGVQATRDYAEAQQEAESAAKRAATAGVSAGNRIADAMADASREASQLARDMDRDAGASIIRQTELMQSYGDSWIDQWGQVDRGIKEAQRSAEQALTAMQQQEILDASITARRSALDSRLSAAEVAHRAEVEDSEALWRLNFDLAHESDADRRKQIEEQYKRQVDLTKHQREVEASEARWKAENVDKPLAELAKQLHDEEVNRRRAAIEKEQTDKIAAINAEWSEWQKVEADKTARAIEEEKNRATGQLAEMKANFWDRLPDAASGGIAALAAQIDAAFAASTAQLVGGNGGGGGPAPGQSLWEYSGGTMGTDPAHEPAGEIFEIAVSITSIPRFVGI